MTTNFNQQFLLIDFALLDDPGFLKFLASTECVTYIMLRRHVWRQSAEHHMGLHDYYVRHKKLSCSLNRDDLARALAIRPNQVSLHLSKLKKWQVIETIHTGRQSIFVLGEWVDVSGDGSYRGVEWFYLDRRFGISKDDVLRQQGSDLRKMQRSAARNTGYQATAPSRDQSSSESGQQPGYIKGTVNGNGGNEKGNTVTVGNRPSDGESDRHPVSRLNDLDQPRDKTEALAREIAEALGDSHSIRFYFLVAAKVPDSVIRRTVAEIKADGAQHPARVFNYRMRRYAQDKLAQSQEKTVSQLKQEFATKHSVKRI
jgi:hypothetical protein